MIKENSGKSYNYSERLIMPKVPEKVIIKERFYLSETSYS
jgi:hypothetical protein